MELWTDTELDALASAGELEISSLRGDGTVGSPVTIWAVRNDDDVYVRSVNGPSATWYRAAKRRGTGRISSGGVERRVQFLDPEGDVEDAIDRAYRDKYGASSSASQRITAPLARETTIRLTPADPD
jgi:hypothetical protein